MDYYLAEHPEPARGGALLLSLAGAGRGAVCHRGPEGDAILLVNLVDELTYWVYSNMGVAPLAKLLKGGFIATRLTPVGDDWLLSGAVQTYSASQRDEIYRAAAKLALEHPKLVFRNPRKLEQAWELQRQDRRDFIAFFGSDLVVLPGRELTERMREYMHFKMHGVRDAEGLTRAEKAQREYGCVPPLPVESFDEDLRERETVGVIYDEVEGLNFFPDFGLVEEAFQNPDLAGDERHREAVRGYVQSPYVSPLPLRRLAERYPQNVDKVFVKAFPARKSFTWKRYGESFLQRYKPSYYNQPTLPAVSPISDELSRALHAPPPARTEPARRSVGRNEPCPCGSGKKYKHCCGR